MAAWYWDYNSTNTTSTGSASNFDDVTDSTATTSTTGNAGVYRRYYYVTPNYNGTATQQQDSGERSAREVILAMAEHLKDSGHE